MKLFPSLMFVMAASARGGRAAAKLETERLLFEVKVNHQSRLVLRSRQPVTADCLELRPLATAAHAPAALFDMRC